MRQPFISCVCPTYKRPELLQNAIACFAAQDYPKNLCELIVLDDADQFSSSTKGNVKVVSVSERFANLPSKFNYLVQLTKGEVIAVWEDDDIYLPWHLSSVAECHSQYEHGFYTSENVWCTFQQVFGEVERVASNGLFHSSWCFSRELFERVGGYPESTELSFDQALSHQLELESGVRHHYGKSHWPSYVYRWGNGYWHGSQSGPDGFASIWEYVGSLAIEHQGFVHPKFDEQTEKIYKFLNVNG